VSLRLGRASDRVSDTRRRDACTAIQTDPTMVVAVVVVVSMATNNVTSFGT
jgi:hypothetical protein